MGELKLGQKLYGKPVNNKARYGNDKIAEATIEKIGRKYLTLSSYYRRLHIEDMTEVSDYCADYEWYLSEQEIYDERELEKLLREIERAIPKYGKPKINLNQARRIVEIINEG